VLRWFANDVLVADPHDPAQIEAAVAAGRMYAAFELMGTPDGFDVRATTAAGATIELGGQLAVSDGATLVVDLPRVLGLDPSLPAPEIHARIIRIDAAGATEVVAGEGPQLSAPLSAPGRIASRWASCPITSARTSATSAPTTPSRTCPGSTRIRSM